MEGTHVERHAASYCAQKENHKNDCEGTKMSCDGLVAIEQDQEPRLTQTSREMAKSSAHKIIRPLVNIEGDNMVKADCAPAVGGGISSVGGDDVSVEAGGSAPTIIDSAPPADGGNSSIGVEIAVSIEAGSSAPTIIDGSPPADGGISPVGGETDVSIKAGDSAPTNSRAGHFNVVSYLKEHGYSLRTLAAMSHGLKSDNGTPMFDVAAEPFASMPTKIGKALASDYRREVSRRYSYSDEKDEPLPRPMLWSIPKCQEWLDRHPITDSGELSDIATEIEKYRIVAEKAATERKADDKRSGKQRMLRMMHALVNHDEIKRGYLIRQRAHLTRQRRIAVEAAEKNKAMSDVLTKQMAELDEKILVAEIKMLSS
jgi:hypothetical protein